MSDNADLVEIVPDGDQPDMLPIHPPTLSRS
jgi:hypothetical protein